jgi:transposase
LNAKVRYSANLGNTIMPWEVMTIAEARRQFISLAQQPGTNISALCRRFNISRKTGYQTLSRFRAAGKAALFDRSRRPKRSPMRTSTAMEQAVLAVRREHQTWGGRKIAAQLWGSGERSVPAPSTITAILTRHGQLESCRGREDQEFVDRLLFTKLRHDEIPLGSISENDRTLLIEQIDHGRRTDRRRAIAILASQFGLSNSIVCRRLNLAPATTRRYLRIFAEQGAAGVFARKTNPHRKFDNPKLKDALFSILHQPPRNFEINRTTWTMADLSRTLKKIGRPVGEDVIRIMIRAAGYRWRKARIVLTSNDPDFSERISRIRAILSVLGPDEVFFSIDEYGPFAIRTHSGRSLVGPGEQRLVPQWQQSRGSLIVTAAIELSSNQVTHFYSTKKNSGEMIRMMEVLVDQYQNRKTIYLSWDAASWHVSKELFKRIELHNNTVGSKGPIVDTAPLPARAQFLNVIESIFSGMARAIIQNSDYKSVDEAKVAVDRYFAERNAHFKLHPKRAGGKIWGNERTVAQFSESNNCKDPRFR